ncbi:D-Ala-D-Ala carboxypeptidase family metallohydrolase [Coralliovum pocilloporae]|uniref:D-Ala-D-Ala carboxypeptidase family metallohydrolase n=1 Tax=Coralliovum pocilloporae TaxID=3066369 RepID=UPI003307A824
MSTIQDLIANLDSDEAVNRLEEFILSDDSTEEQAEAAQRLAETLIDERLNKAIKRFDSGTAKLGQLVEDLQTVIDGAPSADRSIFSGLLDRANDLYQSFYKTGAPSSAFSDTSEADQDTEKDDEADAPPATTPEPEAQKPDVPAIEEPPVVNTSKDYGTIAKDYVRIFFGLQIRSSKQAIIKKLADKAIANKARYEAVGNPLGIPWWFIAGIHLMESNYNFATHLHNGDRLTARTTRVPAGHPKTGSPPFSWEESARDAMIYKKYNGKSDWSLSRALYRWEKYNGWGYRMKGKPSPYLWSFSSAYEKGKYVADGKYSPTAVSKQCGVAVFLRHLYDAGEATLYTDENEQLMNADMGAEKKAIEDGTLPLVPTIEPSSNSFVTFYNDTIKPHVTNFEAAEFLVKGNSHHNSGSACFGLNTDPPEDLWEKIVPLAKVLDEFRNRIDHPVKLLSVYRSPAYNACIGGATQSHHMQFHAADLVVLNSGTGPRDWARILEVMRTSDGLFKGGLKAYKTFVHVDTRGVNKTW